MNIKKGLLEFLTVFLFDKQLERYDSKGQFFRNKNYE